jgi:repressor LexA
MAITRRQKEVIDFLSNFTQKNGYSPSYEEIAHGLGLTSLATVHKHVTNLQNKGLLQRAHNRSRSIDVLPRALQQEGLRPSAAAWPHRCGQAVGGDRDC